MLYSMAILVSIKYSRLLSSTLVLGIEMAILYLTNIYNDYNQKDTVRNNKKNAFKKFLIYGEQLLFKLNKIKKSKQKKFCAL